MKWNLLVEWLVGWKSLVRWMDELVDGIAAPFLFYLKLFWNKGVPTTTKRNNQSEREIEGHRSEVIFLWKFYFKENILGEK